MCQTYSQGSADTGLLSPPKSVTQFNFWLTHQRDSHWFGLNLQIELAHITNVTSPNVLLLQLPNLVMVRDTKTTYSPLSGDDIDATTRLLTEEHEMFTSHHLCGSTATFSTWIVVVLAVLVMSFALSTILFAGLWFQARSTSDSITDPQLVYCAFICHEY